VPWDSARIRADFAGNPFYLKKIGEVKAHHWLLSAIALLMLIVPIVGTVWPAPAYPCNYFAYIFGAYILLGVIWVFVPQPQQIESKASARCWMKRRRLSAAFRIDDFGGI